jgi:hypothetical protein
MLLGNSKVQYTGVGTVLRRGIVTLTWTISGNKYVCEQDVRVN